jgi:hypothetical protein
MSICQFYRVQWPLVEGNVVFARVALALPVTDAVHRFAPISATSSRHFCPARIGPGDAISATKSATIRFGELRVSYSLLYFLNHLPR